MGQDRSANPAQRNRTLALVRAGFEDGPALTVASTDGEIPQGRELSFAWLTGTVMTGLTSVLLMGAALYVSFQGQDTFATAYEALRTSPGGRRPTDLVTKTDRIRTDHPDQVRDRRSSRPRSRRTSTAAT